MNVLEVKNVGKAYKKYHSEVRRVLSWFGLPFKPVDEHWVLRDISFTVEKGESIGLLGQNGAGKSTLLKMITGTLTPTEGSITVNGKISAILELGMGFNPEFTGEQNAIYGLGLMGYRTGEIMQVMPEIEAFADIGEYFYQPVRTYSSGMQVRVAFAVATAFRPDILIVDEALAVGDAAFQQKCYDRISQFQRNKTTLLYVSHSQNSIYSLCDRAILIHERKIRLDDRPKAVIDLYNALLIKNTNPGSINVIQSGDGVGSYSNGKAEIVNVRMQSEGVDTEIILSGARVFLQVEVKFLSEVQSPHVGFQIRNNKGVTIYSTTTYGLGVEIGKVTTGDELMVGFEFNVPLLHGEYTVTAGISNDPGPTGKFNESIYRKQNAIIFNVLKNNSAGIWTGVVDMAPICSVRK